MNGGDADTHQRGRSGFDNRAQQSSPPAAKGKQKSLHVVVSNYDSNANDDEVDEGDNDTVGSLLAEIANILADALRMLMFADKRHWGSDEFEQVRAFEDALDEAKGDFQELGPLLKGSFYYENDRRRMFGPIPWSSHKQADLAGCHSIILPFFQNVAWAVLSIRSYNRLILYL